MRKQRQPSPQRRSHERLKTVLSVHVDGQPGETRDVSPVGLCLEMEQGREIGSIVTFEVELNGTQPMLLIGTARVVRSEQVSQKTSFGMQIIDSRIVMV